MTGIQNTKNSTGGSGPSFFKLDFDVKIDQYLGQCTRKLGMGIVENSTVRFSSRFCFYGSVLSRFPKRFINDISWIRNYAMECVAELA